MNISTSSATVVTLVLAAVIQIFGYLTSILGALAHPVNAIILCGAGLIVMTPVAFGYVFDRTPRASVLVDAHGHPLITDQRTYPRRRRVAVGAVWAVFLIVSVVIIGVRARALLRPVVPPVTPPLPGTGAADGAISTDEYPIRFVYNTLIEPGTVASWGGDFALSVSVKESAKYFGTDRPQSVRGAILDQSRGPGWGKWSLGVGVYVIQFDMTAKPERGPVKIDQILVRVDAHRPPPESGSQGAAPIGGGLGRFYYTTIKPPEPGKGARFVARYLPERDNEQEGIVFLEAGKPERFTIKVNASEPGYYMLSAEVLLSCGPERQRYVLGNWNHVIFSR